MSTVADMTVHGLLAGGSDPALVDPDGVSITRDELLEKVESLGGQLLAAGASPGDGVALLVGQGTAAVIAFLATARIGAIAMPLNPLLLADEIGASFQDCVPTVLVTDVGGHAAGAEAAGRVGARVCSLGPDCMLDRIPPWTGALPDPSPDDVALLLHTSGTTSRPKSVPLRHRNLSASAQSIAAGYSLGADDASYCLMPVFHVHGLVASTLAAFAGRGRVVVPKRLRPTAVWNDATAHQVTWLSAVPTVLARLPERGDAAGAMRFTRSCSSALAPDVWSALEERFGVPVVEAYGMTEAAHQMASNPLPPGTRRAGTVGLPAGAQIAILDESWAPLEAGRSGEVAVRGAGVIDGYLANAQANAESFRDGWFRTGDLGRLSGDGYLTLEGRIKELINRAGEKIAPREIDEALLAHPLVAEAVAYGVPDDKYGEVVHAAVVAREVDAAQLRTHCGERLAPFKVPVRIHVLAEIPKSATGKVQRRLLASLLEP
jgi:acyl-CoA synthetase (AMP-forming)/AMP-acid ligase II